MKNFLDSKKNILFWLTLIPMLLMVVFQSKMVDAILADKALDYGVFLEYSHRELRLDGIYLHNVTLKKGAAVAVDSVRITPTFSLKDGRFSFFEITLKGFQTHLSYKQLAGLLPGKSAQKALKRKASVPYGDIRIEGGEITLFDRMKEKSDSIVKNITATISKKDGYAAISFSKWLYDEKVLLSDIKLELKKKAGDHWRFLASSQKETIKSWSASGQLIPQEKRVKGLLKLSGIPQFLEPWALYIKNKKELLSAIKLDLSIKPNRLSYDVHLGLANPILESKTLGKLPVGPFPIRLRTKGQYFFASDSLLASEAYITFKNNHVKDSKVTLRGSLAAKPLVKSGFLPQVKFALSMKETKCQKIKSIIPKGLMPVLEGFTFSGTHSFNLQGSLPLAQPDLFKYKYSEENLCGVENLPYKYQKNTLARRTARTTLENPAQAGDPFVRIQRNYTKASLVSPYFLKSLVAFEDAAFYLHKGVDAESIKEALRKNLQKKKIMFGGSTITMQTAKNLFLSHKRTISRKLQEVFLSWHLENIFTKDKILEIYANIIEYGPNIYGIHEASYVYFNKYPKDLSLRESAFLASLLPSPLSRFSNFCKGYLSSQYKDFIATRLKHLEKYDKVSHRDFKEAMRETLRFANKKGHPYCQKLTKRHGNTIY